MNPKKLPKGLRSVHQTAVKCIAHLVAQGHTVAKAEAMVMQHLKESHDYLAAGMYPSVSASLKMTFLNQTVDQAATELINSLTESE